MVQEKCVAAHGARGSGCRATAQAIPAPEAITDPRAHVRRVGVALLHRNEEAPMPQPDDVSALGVPDPAGLDDDIKAVFDKCVEKIGFVPNVLRAYSLRPNKLRNFRAMSNELMLAPSGLSKLEREMVAVVVSCANHCYYCL